MDKLNKILSKILNVSIEKTEENLTMDDVDYWDSLTHMNLIVSIEEELDIELSGDDIAEMTTFNSIKAIVAKYL